MSLHSAGAQDSSQNQTDFSGSDDLFDLVAPLYVAPATFAFPTGLTPPHYATAAAPGAATPAAAESGITDFGTRTVNAGAVTFSLDFQYLTGSQAPTQAFIALIESAAKTLSAAISNVMTVNLTIGFGELDGDAVTNGGAEAGPVSSTKASYTTVRADLLAGEPNDPNLAALPTGATIAGQSNIVVWGAEEKALGLVSATSSQTDGEAGFSTGIDDDQLLGVALHELTHAMGRFPDGPTPDIFDFTRLTSAGNYDLDNSTPTSIAAYFSIDGGKTELAAYGEDSDPSDFANSGIGTPSSSLTPNDPFDQYYTSNTVQGLTPLDLKQLDVLGFDTAAATPTPCYRRGARIRTALGDVAVEALRVGDLAMTASGALRPIVWLGRRRLDLTRHPDPASVRPVCVQAGAFGPGLPLRDLWLSPGHSLACQGALIPVSRLVNGLSVQQIAADEVEYWHVELDAHDILLAEGLPAESYLDCGNRAGFANGAAFIEAHPDFAAKHWADTCLPLVLEGPPVAATKARLLARLAAQGYRIEREADAHIVVDGVRIEPKRVSETRLVFALPAGGRRIELRSNVFVPAHGRADSADARTLGLSVGRLQIDGVAMPLDDDALWRAGWHRAEFPRGRFSHRWTDGAAALPAGAREVTIDQVDFGSYWRNPDGAAAARVA